MLQVWSLKEEKKKDERHILKSQPMDESEENMLWVMP